MFEEYNSIANDYSLDPFQSVDEVVEVIKTNLTEDDIERLLSDQLARIAFAGCIIGAMVGANVVVVVEGDGSGTTGETTH